MKLNIQNAKMVLAALALIGGGHALALDVSQCPEKISVSYKGVQRLSEQELESHLKNFNSPVTGFDYTLRIRKNWTELDSIDAFSVSANIFRREDNQSVFHCSYLTGQAGVWIKITEGIASDRNTVYLVVSTPFGTTKTKVLNLDKSGLVLSQELNGRQIINSEDVDFGEGSVELSTEIATASEIQAK